MLKSFYPVADLRTMEDVDVLVPPSQLEKVDELLSRRGYEKKSILNEKHHAYERPGLQIEVHWTLGSLKCQQGPLTFEEHLWLHLQPIEINQKTYWTLSDEDFLIHLILHAAGYMRSARFGIRQLCDLTLWVEQHPNLDGLYIETQLEVLRLTRFSVYLLQICHRLLDLELSERWLHEAIAESAIQTFMSAIFLMGSMENEGHNNGLEIV